MAGGPGGRRSSTGSAGSGGSPGAHPSGVWRGHRGPRSPDSVAATCPRGDVCKALEDRKGRLGLPLASSNDKAAPQPRLSVHRPPLCPSIHRSPVPLPICTRGEGPRGRQEPGPPSGTTGPAGSERAARAAAPTLPPSPQAAPEQTRPRAPRIRGGRGRPDTESLGGPGGGDPATKTRV